MQKLYPALLLFFISNFTSAQNEFCLTDKIWAEMVSHDSTLYYQRKMADDALVSSSPLTYGSPSASHSNSRSAQNPIVIPTVVYIVHDGTPASNISMQQIQSQMDQLNENFDSIGIRFCYAKRNLLDSTYFIPQSGDSAGVFRINNVLTNLNEHTQDAQLKALSTLPSQNYFRIFVVKSISPVGVLGYALYPGTNAARDGVVVRADVFGSRNFCPSCNLMAQYNLGATMTHEAGHYLNLYHTFNGGCVTGSGPEWQTCQVYGDRVCDTPPTTGSYGCPSPAPLSCDSVPVPVKIENFMDYTTDACKNSFTAGQGKRIEHAVYAYRAQLVTTENLINTGIACISLSGFYATMDCDNYNGCLNDTMVFRSLNSNGYTYTWDFGDETTTTGVNGYHAYPSTGQYVVTLTATNPQGISESSSMPVFITECSPIFCGYNKWEFRYGYLDFSSGKPIATNHIDPPPGRIFPDFYSPFYRADSMGVPLLHLYKANAGSLYDTSFNLLDTLGYSSASHLLVRCPSRENKFCFVKAWSNVLDYTILDAHNGTVTIPAGKKRVVIPIQPPAIFGDGQKQLTAIPNCDGTKFWIIVLLLNGTLNVYELNANDTIMLHQSYSVPGMGIYARNIIASPDGRKIIVVDYGSLKGFRILNFNKSTGMIISYYSISENFHALFTETFSNLCFSPNSRFLYRQSINSAGSESYIYQYDLNNPNPLSTRRVIDQFEHHLYVGSPLLGFQLGPDNKIYFGYNMSPANDPHAYRLSIINFPNQIETGLNSVGYNRNGPMIRPPNCPYPSINNSGFGGYEDRHDAFGCHWKPNAPPTFNYYSSNCNSYKFYSDNCYSRVWNFGDPASGANNTSTLSDPSHTFTAAGNYLVTLTTNGQTFSDTIRIERPSIQIAGTDLQNCVTLRSNYSIVQPQSDINYNWSITGGLPAYVASATDVDIQWAAVSPTAKIKVVAVNEITGCADSITIPAKFSVAPTSFQRGICSGESYSYNGQILTQGGNYADTLFTAGGCDSIVTLNLIVKENSSSSFSHGICAGESYLFNGRNLSTEGSYNDTLISASGCDSIITLTLVVNELPLPSVIKTNDTLSTQTFASYQWLRNGVVISGATSQSLPITQTGNYSVIVTDDNGCRDTSDALTVFSVDIAGNISDFGIKLYPNPNTGDFVLEFSDDVFGEIEITDALGREIFPPTKAEKKKQFHLDNLPNGIYFLLIMQNGVTRNLKFCLMK